MPLRHTLLRLLQWQPMHGYVLRQRAQEYAWIYPMANASIYPALHGLEKEGFIGHRSEISNGRARKVYQITDAGRQELRQWLADRSQKKPSFRDQTLLKIAMQGDDTIAEAQHGLEEELAAVATELQESLKAESDIPQMSRYARLATNYGTELISLRKRFLEQVLATAKSERRRAVTPVTRRRNSKSLSA